MTSSLSSVNQTLILLGLNGGQEKKWEKAAFSALISPHLQNEDCNSVTECSHSHG